MVLLRSILLVTTLCGSATHLPGQGGDPPPIPWTLPAPERPVIAMVMGFAQEPPGILHVVGEHFGREPHGLRVSVDDFPAAFRLENEHHLVVISPFLVSSTAALSCTVTVSVLNVKGSYHARRVPVVEAATQLLLPEREEGALPFNALLRMAFPMPEEEAASDMTDVHPALDAHAPTILASPLASPGFETYIANTPTQEAGIMVCGDIRMNLGTAEVWVEGVPKQLTPSAYSLLSALALRQGEPVTMAELRQELWPGKSMAEVLKNIAPRASRLREQLEQDAKDPYYVLAVPKVGYRLNATPRDVAKAAAVANRPSGAEGMLACGALSVFVSKPEVLLNGATLAVSPLEHDLLVILATHLGRMVPYGELQSRLLPGEDAAQAQARIRTMMRTMQKLLEPGVSSLCLILVPYRGCQLNPFPAGQRPRR